MSHSSLVRDGLTFNDGNIGLDIDSNQSASPNIIHTETIRSGGSQADNVLPRPDPRTLLARLRAISGSRNYDQHQHQESLQNTSNSSSNSSREVPFTGDRDVDDLPLPPPPEPLVGIEARIEELTRRLPTLRDPVPSADTLIYLGRLSIENEELQNKLKAHFSGQPLLVERSRLMDLNSPYFNKFLGPFYQTKRWKTLKPQIMDYILPQSIKYIINMTPDTEGMDAVQAIQDLSAPAGVLQWNESNLRWSNSRTIVGGEDESDGPSRVEEYSRIRHLKSIERFMFGLQGQDPGIDSATKLYTTVMVSKPWNIQGTHPMTDWALGWLCADPNTRFIEALPETVLKMAEVMKCASLCKDAFGVLVGEAVLDSAVNSTRPGFVHSKATVYERSRGDIEEDWQNRIQHARNSFTDRIQKTFDDLVGNQMEWVAHLQDVRNIRRQAIGLNKIKEYEDFLELLKQFLRGSIYKLLCSDYFPMTESWENSQAGGDSLYPRNSGPRTWQVLRAQERIFTRWFWKILSTMFFGTVTSTTQTNHTLILSCFAADRPSAICQDYYNTPLLGKITVGRLDKAALEIISPEQYFVLPSKRVTAGSLRQNHSTTETLQTSPVAFGASNTTGTMRDSLGFPARPLQQENVAPIGTGRPLLSTSNTNSNWKDLSLSTLIGTPEAKTEAPADQSKSQGNHPRCNYWSCATHLFSEVVIKVCSYCESTYCSRHVPHKVHFCSRSLPYPKLALTSNQKHPYVPDDTVSTGAMPKVLDPSSPTKKRSETGLHEDKRDEIANWITPVPHDHGDDIDMDRPSEITYNTKLPMFRRILVSATAHVHSIAKPMLSGVRGGNLGGSMFDYHLLQTLACLNDEEAKFLPLWADGLDDGTGGVFGDHVPEAGDNVSVLGPGGPRYAARSEGSDCSFASGSINTTVNTSTLGHDGYRDTLPRGRVVAADDSDTSSLGGWSYIQGEINVKKGKQPAIFTPDESEVATTLGALEDASVIDLEIKAQGGLSLSGSELSLENSVSKDTSTTSTPEATHDDKEDHLDDIFMGQASDDDEEAFDSDNMEDSDMDIIDSDDLEEETPEEIQVSSSAAVKTSTSAIKNGSDLPKPKTSSASRPAWENQESLANVVYVYKGGKGDGNDDDDDDLMTRL